MLGLARFGGFAGFVDSPGANFSLISKTGKEWDCAACLFLLELGFIFALSSFSFFLLLFAFSFLLFCFFFSSFFASFYYPRLRGNGRRGFEVDLGLPGAK